MKSAEAIVVLIRLGTSSSFLLRGCCVENTFFGTRQRILSKCLFDHFIIYHRNKEVVELMRLIEVLLEILPELHLLLMIHRLEEVHCVIVLFILGRLFVIIVILDQCVVFLLFNYRVILNHSLGRLDLLDGLILVGLNLIIVDVY